MKKRLIVIALAVLSLRAGAQAVNPQSTFGGAVGVNSPSLWLNFNDATASFQDSVSGLSFGATGSLITPNLGAPAGAASGNTLLQNYALSAGTISAFVLQMYTAPTAGQSITCGTFTGSGTSWTPTAHSFVFTLAATTAAQSFSVTPFAVAAGSIVGCWSASGTANVSTVTASGHSWLYGSGAQTAYPTATATYSNVSGAGLALSVAETLSSAGTATAQQQGFDNTNNTNYSASFPYNAWNAAPNTTLGSFDWFTPSSMMVHVDRLNWTRSGTLVLASKGDVGSTANSYWELYLQMNGSNSQLCYTRNAHGSAIGSWGGQINQGICTSSSMDVMPNGFNYNIVVTDSGTGNSGWTGTQALNMYINGLQVGASSGIAGSFTSGSYQYGFGGVQVSVVSGGTGFTASTNFTSTGGGANCTVAGYITESGGSMPTGTSGVVYTSDYGCTSAPTITLISPNGTGATFSTTLSGASVVSPAPLMVPGYVSNGVFNGIAGATSGQTPTVIDEFAEFPSVLSFGAISNIFYETKFYQAVVNTATPKPVIIVDDDTFVDSDNELLLAMAIGAHKAGVITLAGVVVEDYTPAAIAAWRQILDSAGLNDVPVTIPPVNPGSPSGYAPTNVTAYNASTPLTLGAWGSSTAMYRAIFAKYPTSPIKVMLGGPVWGAFAAFMQSAADGISPLTGLQLVAQNGANGGAAYGQGGLYDWTANGGYVVANNQSMPIIWIGGTPMNGGPGALSTRMANDPLWMWFNSNGGDVRQCYDCLMLEAAISSYFTFGVSMTASGGTGYAASTPFTLSGTGANSKCQGTGYITASGGVMNGVEFAWGSSAVGSYSGVGSGCIATPTVTLTGSTGSGGTITAVPAACGEYTVSGGIPQSYVATTCGNQYIVPGSFNTDQSPVSGAVMTWLINSWVDPAMPGGVGNQQ